MKFLKLSEYVSHLNDVHEKKLHDRVQNDTHKIELYKKIIANANFRERPPALWMFCAVDDKGQVLYKPKHADYEIQENELCPGWDYLVDLDGKSIGFYDKNSYVEATSLYYKAKRKILFNDITIYPNGQTPTILFGEIFIYNEGAGFWIEKLGELEGSGITLSREALKDLY